MLEEVLTYLNNWFVCGIYHDTYTIQEDGLQLSFLQEGQYFRIVGSVFNDGVYQYGEDNEWHPETFSGAIWALAIPKVIIDIAKEIKAWQAKYGDVTAGPYSSESFGGYSYTKATGQNGEAETWQTAFESRLAPYRKLRDVTAVESGQHQDPGYERPFNPEYPWR